MSIQKSTNKLNLVFGLGLRMHFFLKKSLHFKNLYKVFSKKCSSSGSSSSSSSSSNRQEHETIKFPHICSIHLQKQILSTKRYNNNSSSRQANEINKFLQICSIHLQKQIFTDKKILCCCPKDLNLFEKPGLLVKLLTVGMGAIPDSCACF